jgi:cell wall-associated NlpC family hydrolase
LLGFKIHHAIHHVGVMIQPGMFVHACEGCGVIYSSTQDATWSKRLARIWRPIWARE